MESPPWWKRAWGFVTTYREIVQVLTALGVTWSATLPLEIYQLWASQHAVPQTLLFLFVLVLAWLFSRLFYEWLWIKIAPIEIGVEVRGSRFFLRVQNNRPTEKFEARVTHANGNGIRWPAQQRLPWAGSGRNVETIPKGNDMWLDLGDCQAKVSLGDDTATDYFRYDPPVSGLDSWEEHSTVEQSVMERLRVPIKIIVRVVARDSGRSKRVRVDFGRRLSLGTYRTHELFVEATDLDTGARYKRSHHTMMAKPGRISGDFPDASATLDGK